MNFEVKKTENCFSGAQTYEYRLPLTGQELARRLSGWSLRENHAFRRPVFTAERGGLTVKGILAARVVRVSFPEERWQEEKAAFEGWLEALPGGEREAD